MAMATCRHLFFIAPLAVILVVMLMMLLWIDWEGLRALHLGTLLPTALLVLALIVVLISILWQRWKAGKTCYALSSRRALVFQPRLLGKLFVRSYTFEELKNARFKRSWLFGPHAGDWVFQRRESVKVTRYYEQGIPIPVRTEVARGVKLYGFLMLRNATELGPLFDRVLNRRGRQSQERRS